MKYREIYKYYLTRYDLNDLLKSGFNNSDIESIEKKIDCKFPISIKILLEMVGGHFFSLFIGGGGGGDKANVELYFENLKTDFRKSYVWKTKNNYISFVERDKIEALLRGNNLLVLNMAYHDDLFWYCNNSDADPMIYFESSDQFPISSSFTEFAIKGFKHLFEFNISLLKTSIKIYERDEVDSLKIQKLKRKLLKWESIVEIDDNSLDINM